MTNTDALDKVADAYGGEILADADLDAMGEPDEEQAYEDVVGPDDAGKR